MNKFKRFFTLSVSVLVFAVMPLAASDGDESQANLSDFVRSLLNNQYLQENIRLVGLAEGSFTEGRYSEAINYAEEANRYADLSDQFVSMQNRIRDANEAIAAAEARLNWARSIGGATRFADIFNEASELFARALEQRNREEWDEARDSALGVLALLETIPGEPARPTLAAQYLVRNWHTTKDCLWNIAAMPEIYGDPWQWRVLYRANRHKLRQPDNPDLIHPGMILDIPSIRGEIREGLLEQR